ICDRFGARRSLAVGFMVCGLFLAAVALQTAVLPVFCLLFVSGCGYTVTSPGTTKLVVDWFPAARRGIPSAIKQCGPMLAVMLLALIAPVLALVAGWQPVIAGVGFLIAGSGVLCWLWCPDEPTGRSSNATGSWTGSLGLFKQRDVLLLCGVGTVLVIAQTGVSSYLVLYAVEDLHIPLVAAGWCLGAAQVTGLLGRLTVGLISDRYYGGRRKPVIAALCVITATGLLALGLIPGGASLITVLAASLLIGLGALSWSAIVILAVAERAGRNQAGLAVGFTVMTFQSAIVVAPPLIGRALDLPGSHNWVWTALGFAMLLALVLTWPIDESSK
ncbi:MAG: MFS transporter, partial [Chloroflexi bacterium]|nr:MFS transporter [Chloroflexota bacterium]